MLAKELGSKGSASAAIRNESPLEQLPKQPPYKMGLAEKVYARNEQVVIDEDLPSQKVSGAPRVAQTCAVPAFDLPKAAGVSCDDSYVLLSQYLHASVAFEPKLHDSSEAIFGSAELSFDFTALNQEEPAHKEVLWKARVEPPKEQ